MQKNMAGLTLVEMLVVIAVLALVGGLLMTIFTRTLRGSNKSQLLGVIKQNGQSVLETIDKTIRNSDNIVCVSTPSSNSLIVVQDGVYTRFKFIPSVTVNGKIEQDNPVKLVVSGQEEPSTQFINRICSDTDGMVQSNILTDTNPKTGTSVISAGGLPFIIRNSKSGFKDNVKIQFALKPGVGAPTVVAGQIDPVTFETTVQLR